MSFENILNIKESERDGEFGKNIELHAMLIRHAQRGAGVENEIPLTEEGIEKSREFGSSLEKKYRIEGEHSDTVRTRDTLKEIVDHSPSENKLELKERKELSFHCSDEFVDRTMAHVKEVLRKEYGNFDYRKLSEEEKKRIEVPILRVGLDYYLSFGDKRPDKETYSPVETAATVAKRIDNAIRKVDRLHSGTKMDAIFVSHDYVVTAFLNELLVRQEDGKKVRGFDSLQDIGGPIDFLEGPEFIVRTDEAGKKSIEFIFRGKDYEFDSERFNELVKIATRLEKEELRKNEDGIDEVLEEKNKSKIG